MYVSSPGANTTTSEFTTTTLALYVVGWSIIFKVEENALILKMHWATHGVVCNSQSYD
jgi:hypothetical protein